MKFTTKFHDQSHVYDPCVVTVGFFDGMHIGHQHLFKKIQQIKTADGFSCVVSFSNHPKTVLKPDETIELINTNEQRIELIKKQKVDSLIFLPFTEKLKELSPDDFISLLLENLSFTDLVLGFDSTIGKDKEGDFELMKLLSKKFAFRLHRIEAIKIGPSTVSSTLVRRKVKEGDFKTLEKLLNRPYSILATVEAGESQGAKLGFPTLNCPIDGLALPPHGVYKVLVEQNGVIHKAIANLGFAPTLKHRTTPILEVHILDGQLIDPKSPIEVIFQSFIRSEKKFNSIDSLKAQIALDIQMARKD